MLKYIVSALVLSSLNAETSSEKYTSYEEKIEEERDFISKSRDLKAQSRKSGNGLYKLTDRRDIVDKARELRSSVRDERAEREER